MRRYVSLKLAIDAVISDFRQYATDIHTEKWQGVSIAGRPEARMKELMYSSFCTSTSHEDLDYYRGQIGPNLPWADDHFLERVSGQPLNPGEQWKKWPWGHSANRHRTEGEQYNHTYMERFWPKHAGLTPGGLLGDVELPVVQGIRCPYGDLNDLVNMMAAEPLTRQAYLPIYFPEDTGNDGRKPCTLGYLFYMRNDRLDVSYYIRSCDVFRHFRDDVYLTIRLMLWVLDQLRQKDDRWKTVKPGLFRMDIGSLHCFINDFAKL